MPFRCETKAKEKEEIEKHEMILSVERGEGEIHTQQLQLLEGKGKATEN